MTDRSPIVAFGMFALTVALKAKTGQVSMRDQLGLATRALDWALGDDAARRATCAFLAGVSDQQEAAVAAGQAYLDFLGDWMDALGIERTEAATVESGAMAAPPAPEPQIQARAVTTAPAEYDWQKRADAGLE